MCGVGVLHPCTYTPYYYHVKLTLFHIQILPLITCLISCIHKSRLIGQTGHLTLQCSTHYMRYIRLYWYTRLVRENKVWTIAQNYLSVNFVFILRLIFANMQNILGDNWSIFLKLTSKCISHGTFSTQSCQLEAFTSECLPLVL